MIEITRYARRVYVYAGASPNIYIYICGGVDCKVMFSFWGSMVYRVQHAPVVRHTLGSGGLDKIITSALYELYAT